MDGDARYTNSKNKKIKNIMKSKKLFCGIKHYALILVAIAALSSCATQQKILYLQDNVINQEIEIIKGGEIRFQPNDIISIFVNSKNPELAAVFNLPRVQATVGNQSLSASASSQYSGVLNYTLNSNGEIDFPVLGTVMAKGKTKSELAEYLKKEIINSGLIKDPVITVEYANLTFTTMGEVTRPGNYNIKKEKTTILEALGMSGDLTINGVRDRVFLTRQLEDNKIITYQLDLKSDTIYNSPAFYVQQNDVIYVEPNRFRSNQSTASGNSFFTTQFWISLASLATSIATLFIVHSPAN